MKHATKELCKNNLLKKYLQRQENSLFLKNFEN